MAHDSRMLATATTMKNTGSVTGMLVRPRSTEESNRSARV